ncbi:hypothetical protein ACU4GD_10555 [Cupriavidus basilensis]
MPPLIDGRDRMVALVLRTTALETARAALAAGEVRGIAEIDGLVSWCRRPKRRVSPSPSPNNRGR